MPPPAKRGIMRNEFRQPDEQNMRQLLHQHPEDLPGLILRLAWLQGLSREEIVALKWAQVDFQERSLFLEDRTVPLEEETAGCLAARFENGGAVSPYVVISDKFREPLRTESVSRIARNALTAGGLPQLQLKDLRRDYFSASWSSTTGPMPSGSAVCRSPPSKPALPETPRTKSVQHRQGSNSMNSVCGRSFKRRTAPPRALLCG